VLCRVIAASGVREGLDRRLVIWSVALVVEGSSTVTLEVDRLLERRVDRKLLVVDCKMVWELLLAAGRQTTERKTRMAETRTTETVAVGVSIGKEPRLENGVCRSLHAGNRVARGESGLLNLGKVVLGVLVCVKDGVDHQNSHFDRNLNNTQKAY
jgi:hypothetical protein